MRLPLISLLLCTSLFVQAQSTLVTLCENSRSVCFGFDSYTRTVQHFDSLGNLVEENYFVFNGCQGVLDQSMHHDYDNLYTYDASSHLLTSASLVYNGTDTSELKTDYSYDSSGNITSILNSAGLFGNLIPLNYDTSVYDTSGNLVYELRENWTDSTSSWDTTTINQWVFDNQNRLIQSDVFSHDQNSEGHQFYTYDSNSNITQSIFSTNSGGIMDSMRVLESYDSLHNKLETIRQQWDSLQQSWIGTTRMTYFYDAQGLLNEQFLFGCSDSTCSDTISKSVFSYDTQQRQILQSDSSYIGPSQYDYAGNNFIDYDSANNIIRDGYLIVEFGCDESELREYTYNTSGQLIHTHYQHYTCDYVFNDCDYFNLDSDSMLVSIYYPFNVCEGDTVQPCVTVEGGVPPYNVQWNPLTGLIDPHSQSSAIVADTVIAYSLTAADNSGISQTDTFTLNVTCFTTKISEVGADYGIIAYPNPFGEKTIISMKNSEKSVITAELFDMEGKAVAKLSAKSELLIDRKILEPGIYLARIYTDSKFIGSLRLIAQ